MKYDETIARTTDENTGKTLAIIDGETYTVRNECLEVMGGGEPVVNGRLLDLQGAYDEIDAYLSNCGEDSERYETSVILDSAYACIQDENGNLYWVNSVESNAFAEICASSRKDYY